MESLDMEPCFVDDLLNFSSDIDEEEEDKPRRALASSPLEPSGLLGPGGDSVRPFHDLVEEDLEWISNKDAFPAVESFMGILSADPSAAMSKHHSPVSVLDGGGGGGGSTISSNCNSNSNSNSSNSNSNSNSNSITSLTSCFSSLKAPRRVRSKRRCRRRRGDITGRQLCWSQASNIHNKSGNGNVKAKKATRTTVMMMTTIGRKCQHCGADKTPQWRAGPYGPKTLCNACGVRYKSGRLVPEYRPVSSPTFSSELHSNSHRKILEMRRVKQMVGMVVKQPLESR